MTVVTLAIAAAGVGGWWAASVFQSPAQREAAAAAPSPGAVTVPVVAEALAETASARGVVRRVASENVALPAGDGITVVTKETIQAGSVVGAGQVLSELNGRPVIALPGRFAYYRDLMPGDSGPDVAQLQSALVDSGYSLRVDGEFGSATEAAVRALYARIGYSATDKEVTEESESSSDSSDSVDGAPSAGASADPDGEASADPDDEASADTDDEASVNTAALTTTTVRRLVVPAAELSVISTLPATAASVPGVGTVAGTDQAVVALNSGGLVAEVEVAVSLAVRLTQDTPVTATRDDGSQVSCRITSLPTPAADATTVLVQIRPEEGFTDDWLDAQVLAGFVVEEVSGAALVVPTDAVVPGGSEVSQVLVQQDDGSFRLVQVKELGTLGGRTALEPVEPGTLAAGDLVKVA